MPDVYEKLRAHLDQLPGGFPATESGVEIRILKRLFTPEEADLARRLSLKLEPASKIAQRVGLTPDEAEEKLKAMSRKGLIFSIETEDRPPVFMAAQFVVGIWEYHVDRLAPEFVKDMEEYFPYIAREAFDPLPQLRTIPVGKSIQADMHILSYEQARSLVEDQTKFLVAPCICRREEQVKGGGCDKPVENCLMFGWAADYYERNGLGRMIDREETLKILNDAEAAGLVLQPSNARQITNICCCCGDCCQVLRHLKSHPTPARIAVTPFTAQVDADACVACEICVERCQMDAVTMADEVAVVDADRCIGCGLCVTTCSGDAMRLVRKPEDQQKPVPKNMKEAFILRAKARADIESKVRRHEALK